MPGRIPKAFIDQLLSRVDIVEVVERRVALKPAGREFMACCPFHEEKTPSFSVSPQKQFYHCFGCGAHGTAIGFLMEHGNLGFIEAVEELAQIAGLELPHAEPAAAHARGESHAELLAVSADAGRWFQAQLRAPGGREAVAYLKKRGLDGAIAAEFGIGYAPPGWDNLLRALGGDALRRRQLQRAGLLSAKSGGAYAKSGGGKFRARDAVQDGGAVGVEVATAAQANAARASAAANGARAAGGGGVSHAGVGDGGVSHAGVSYAAANNSGAGATAAAPPAKSATHTSDSAAHAHVYDRFRARIMFPIEDRRGRVVAFGGRIIGEGEPKYLNSPETPLFHKGAELYNLHRARRAIGREKRALVVEGYLDVIALAQCGFANSVATLGTATTRAHLQRLFQLAPEVVFCFDGDRAGRDAAWKALQTALPEMQDGRLAGFLFLPDGEDPDSMVRRDREDFAARTADAQSLPDFFFDHLRAQTDVQRADGKARLVALAKPLLAQLPKGALQTMLRERLAKMCGMQGAQLLQLGVGEGAPPVRARRPLPPRARGLQAPISPLALALSLLLQNPPLAARAAKRDLQQLRMPGAETLRAIVDKIGGDENVTTARLLEHFRDEKNIHERLTTLAARGNNIAGEFLHAHFDDTVNRLFADQQKRERDAEIAKLAHADSGEPDMHKVRDLLNARRAEWRAHADAES